MGSTFSNVVFYIWMPSNGLLGFRLSKNRENIKLIFWSWNPKRSPAYPVKTSLTPTRVVLTYQLSNVPHAMAIICLIESCRNHIDRAGGECHAEMVTVHERYADGGGGGIRRLGRLVPSQLGRWRKTSVQTFSNSFRRSCNAENSFQYNTILTEKADPSLSAVIRTLKYLVGVPSKASLSGREKKQVRSYIQETRVHTLNVVIRSGRSLRRCSLAS